MTKTVGTNTLTYTYNATKKHAVANISVNGTARAFTYDNAGNMLTGFDLTGFPSTPPTRTMTYNAENMPSRIQYTISGTTQDTRFYYDGELGRARKEIIGGSSTYYFGDHFERISGADVKYVFANNLRIARIQGTTKVYFHKDHLDSSSAVTSSTGVVLETSKFMPFGELRTHTGTNQSDYKYTDQEQDATTTLYNYGARLYDPTIGLFTTPDPYFSPNLAAHEHYTKVIENSPYPVNYPGSFKIDEFALYFSNPQRLNRFAYVQNNPINFVDPLGLFDELFDTILSSAQAKGDYPSLNLSYHHNSFTVIYAFGYTTVELHSKAEGFNTSKLENGVCSTPGGLSSDFAFSYGDTEGFTAPTVTLGWRCLGVSIDVANGLLIFHFGTPWGVPVDISAPINPEQPGDVHPKFPSGGESSGEAVTKEK